MTAPIALTIVIVDGGTTEADRKVIARRPKMGARGAITANHQRTNRTATSPVKIAATGRATAIVGIAGQMQDGHEMVAAAMKVAARQKLRQPRRRNAPVSIQIRRSQNWLHSRRAWTSVAKVRDHVESGVVEV